MCGICNDVLAEDDIRAGNFIGFPDFGPPHPYEGPSYQHFFDSAIHRTCFLVWPQRDELIRYVNAAQGPTREQLGADGGWHRRGKTGG